MREQWESFFDEKELLTLIPTRYIVMPTSLNASITRSAMLKKPSGYPMIKIACATYNALVRRELDDDEFAECSECYSLFTFRSNHL